MVKRHRLFIEATPLTNKHMSGIAHVTLEIVKALDRSYDKHNYDVRLFVPWDEFKTLGRYEFKNVRVVRLPMPHKVFSLLSRLPFGIPLDLLLGTGDYIFPNFRNWPLLFSKSYTYIHDACFAVFPEYVEEKNRAYLNKYMSMWLRRTDKIITVSESAKKEIQQYLNQPDDRVVVVGNAVNQQEFYPRSHDEVLRVRKKYGLSEDYFLYLGNIEPRKNLKTLITAYSSQDNLRESTELFLVGGDGWLNDDIYSTIDDARERGYKIIKNKSYVPDKDIPALMTGARALIQPSWHEGFGLAVIQALACGTPSICSDIPGLRNAIAGNEHAVTLFDPHSTDDLSEALKDAVKTRKNTTKVTLPSWDASVQILLETINTGGHKT